MQLNWWFLQIYRLKLFHRYVVFQRRTKKSLKSVLFIYPLKGVFEENERGYRLLSNWIRYWSLLNFTFNCCAYKDNRLKTTHTQDTELYYFTQIVNNFIEFKINYSDITTYICQIQFDELVNSWYFMISFMFLVHDLLQQRLFGCRASLP